MHLFFPNDDTCDVCDEPALYVVTIVLTASASEHKSTSVRLEFKACKEHAEKSPLQLEKTFVSKSRIIIV